MHTESSRLLSYYKMYRHKYVDLFVISSCICIFHMHTYTQRAERDREGANFVACFMSLNYHWILVVLLCITTTV